MPAAARACRQARQAILIPAMTARFVRPKGALRRQFLSND